MLPAETDGEHRTPLEVAAYDRSVGRWMLPGLAVLRSERLNEQILSEITTELTTVSKNSGHWQFAVNSWSF